ncbi:hypothetical protein [Ciceribacter sp. L1K22]|uniref:capsular polysaccharide export protein, LipB/KpsS family n=1 Tax=Ciceribacter sp. L1K22 TaxID=2820275 RepID=UPI001ABE6FCF|nr:hypothetical protein [Ciceribacter sp. L1K22]MBO3761554.1 hypothetical protein [Ciceribacter sp. L1K22]
MPTFLFSSLFADDLRRNRVDYLETVSAQFEKATKFIAFNLSGRISSNIICTINAQDEAPDVSASFMDELKALMIEIAPNEAASLWAQAEGEFDVHGPRFRILMKKLYRNLVAFKGALDIHKPDYVYLWNKFQIFHVLASKILKLRKIKFGYFHEGLLPGSITFDVDGEMGESWVSRRADLFQNIKLTELERQRSSRYVNCLKSVTATRHVQSNSIDYKEALKHAGLAGRPIVLYAGQNDWYAGIKPESVCRRYHSPIFTGSLDALYTLDNLANKLDLAIIFKPHPFSRERYSFLKANEFRNSLILGNIDLNRAILDSSIFTTIASQSSYSALLSGKPVVMLGRNQLSYKGITYDVENINGIEDALISGLSDTLRENRATELVEHIARLEKVYLFAFGPPSFFRRGPKEAAEFMILSLFNDIETVIDVVIGRQ